MTVMQMDAQLERRSLQFANASRNAQLTAKRGRARTLDAVLVGVWEDLAARPVTPCLVCGGVMVSDAGRAGGTCRDCGSSLS
jgi:tRNA(Ile2) C34 agmatinyltransferase TiaS